MNYFELFEIPVNINVDKETLSKKYIELQRKFHPDYYTQSATEEQDEALEKSSAINKGLKILKDKDSTIQYILQIKGLLQEDEKYQLPPDFLMEVMEMNEELSHNSAAAVKTFEEDIYKEVQPLIDNYDDATITVEGLLQIKEYYFKKKYLQRILERLDD